MLRPYSGGVGEGRGSLAKAARWRSFGPAGLGMTWWRPVGRDRTGKA